MSNGNGNGDGGPEVIQVGMPFQGFFSRGPKHEAPPGFFTGDSRDWDLSPRQRKWKRRAGSAIVGDTLSGGVEVTGLLPAKWSARARELWPFESASLADAQETRAATYTEETNVWGQVYFRDTNDNTNQVVGGRFASDYPVTGGSNPNRFRMVPFWSENARVMSRCATEQQRRMIVPGTRRSIAFESYRYFPSAQGTPGRINHDFNDSTTTSYAQEVFPWGHQPPLYNSVPTLPSISTVAGGGSWLYNHKFIYTWAFRYEDDSIGPPFIPAPPSVVALNGGSPNNNLSGYVQALSGTSTDTFDYVLHSHVPLGPPGTKSRVFLRTKAVAGATLQPDIATLGIAGEIPDNTTTTFYDYNGQGTPILDSVNIRLDQHKYPRRGRYLFSFYGHVAICGKLKANPGALLICPHRIGGSYYDYDAAGAVGSVETAVIVREDQVANPRVPLVIHTVVSGTGSSTGITSSASATLADVVNTLHQSANGDTVKTKDDWKGQVVPGANPYALTSNLQLTQVYANFSTISGSNVITVQNGGDGDAGSTASIVVGMLVTGADIPAGAYVSSKTATTVTMKDVTDTTAKNAAATHGGGGIALTIGFDFGDTTAGAARCFAGAYPVMLPFKKSYLDTLPTAERDVDFTSADPGHPKYAAQSFYVKNRRGIADRSIGRAIGGGEVLNGAIVCYTKGTAALVNTRGGNTNADDDWQIQKLSATRGTISPEIVQGNGYILRLTPQGIEANDGQQKPVIISDAVFDRSEGTGELAYEIGQCVAATRADTDGGHFHMMLADGVLYVSYRSSGSATTPDRYMKYDFSANIGIGGIGELLDENGNPHPWSTPQRITVAAMVEIRRSDGRHIYGAYETNAGTGDGRIDEIETGTTDNGTAITPIGYHSLVLDRGGGFREFTLASVAVKYAKNGTGFKVGISRDKSRSSGLSDYLAMDSSGSAEFQLRRMPATEAMRPQKEAPEFWFSDDGTGTAPEFEGMLAIGHWVAPVGVRR